MFKKILVPLNGSAEAEQALEPAARLLQPMTGQLILMCLTSQGLLQIPNENQADAGGELSPDEAQAYLAAVEQKTQEFNCLIQTKIVDRDDANAIVETAVAEAVDLVVMGAYGSTGLVSW
ncbi:MAG TPA: universal stress protein, partial [Anaerolineae bacterium]|nr:universal stress protein [Anaerolineae bacterium]